MPPFAWLCIALLQLEWATSRGEGSTVASQVPAGPEAAQPAESQWLRSGKRQLIERRRLRPSSLQPPASSSLASHLATVKSAMEQWWLVARAPGQLFYTKY
jgi:hypothetical protein